MVKPVVAAYVVADFLLLATGVLLIGAGAVWQRQVSAPPTQESIGRIMLLERCPLVAVIANGVLVVLAFIVSLPSFVMPESRSWLKVHSWLVMCCLLFTLVLGLNEWIQTLATRANLQEMWGQFSDDAGMEEENERMRARQRMLQRKFDCCGYTNWTTPVYVPDHVCTNDITASAKEGCVGPFAAYAERWLSILFTGAFGLVGMDVVVLLCAAMLMNSRKEKLRYKLIDEKWAIM